MYVCMYACMHVCMYVCNVWYGMVIMLSHYSMHDSMIQSESTFTRARHGVHKLVPMQMA